MKDFQCKPMVIKHNDTTQLRLLAACFKIEYKKHALDAVRWLREAFQWSVI